MSEATASKVSRWLAEAVRLHQSGQLDAARSLYERILQLQPRHFDALHLSGVVAAQSGHAGKARQLIEGAIAINPQHSFAHGNLGNALLALGKFEAAVASYDRAIALRADFAEAHLGRGNALRALGRLDAAVASYARAIALKPEYVDAYWNRGIALQTLGRPGAAVADHDKAIALRPDFADAYLSRGDALADLGRLESAIASYDKGIAVRPDCIDAYIGRGNALAAAGRLDAAVASYDLAIGFKPDCAEAYNNRGNALRELRQLNEAIASYDRAVALQPGYADAHNNRGIALAELGGLDAAVASYEQAIALEPEHAEAHCNLGSVLQELGQLDAALASYDRAIAIRPVLARAYRNRGVLLAELNNLPAALADFDRAIEISPDYEFAYCNRGAALLRLEQFEAAVANFDRAIALKPDYAEAHSDRGSALLGLHRLEDAVKSFQAALELKPDLDFVLGTLLFTRMQLCDWQAAEAGRATLETKIDRGERVCLPFAALGLTDSPARQKRAAEIWADVKYPPRAATIPASIGEKRQKICIGYYSADLHDHATAHLMAGLFEAHDRTKFELTAFSFGPDRRDPMRQRLSAAFDRFIDVRERSDAQVVQLSRDLQIDIAVDLKGYTTDSRPGIFARRAAPVQVNYLGYPGTMGVKYIDYIVADRTVIPPGCESYYTEKIVFLPYSYQVNDRKRFVPDEPLARKSAGLPDSGFVFCCFNKGYKIAPSIFDSWMKVLHAVTGSALWLFEDNATATVNLRREAGRRGVEPGRLVFAKPAPLPEHLARHRLADLFIDTLPYNAHTTASDALWAGLPVVTLCGQAFAGRVGASLLSAVGLPELIANTQSEYEALAIALATNPNWLGEIKEKLSANRLQAPLFDTALFARHIEAAYTAIYDRYKTGLPAEHLFISP